MLKMVNGCRPPRPDLLSEQYERYGQRLIANVGADKIEAVFLHFVKMQTKPMFFILEIPTRQQDEEGLQADGVSFHKDVYYIKGLDVNGAFRILEEYGELLINDGLSSFGFGVHGNSTELVLDQYNIMTLWTDKMDPYANFFEEHHIPRVENCLTAWDTFSAASPGDCWAVQIRGMTIYDLVNTLSSQGIYFAERRSVD